MQAAAAATLMESAAGPPLHSHDFGKDLTATSDTYFPKIGQTKIAKAPVCISSLQTSIFKIGSEKSATI